ncbi:MAG: hypothetical protein HKM24_06440, partial [Gammaproteobacteria bacterium]|nr:hypothetical protein [Gammaproteobacteria bacterium]
MDSITKLVTDGSIVGLHETGATTEWTTRTHQNIFFPQQRIEIAGKKKLRGGSPRLFPPGTIKERVGTADLPQHGTLRHLIGEPYCDNGLAMLYPGNDSWPWRYRVRACVNEELNGFTSFTSIERDDIGDPSPMPTLFGEHPYIATHGSPFTIRRGMFDRNLVL